jgi:hypothetical protein
MNGFIYKIIVRTGNEIYVGSTLQQVRKRWQDHRNGYIEYVKSKGENKCVSSFVLFEKYGIENCKIILIKNYAVADIFQLRAYEQLWINKLNPINKVNPLPLTTYCHHHTKSGKRRHRKSCIECNPNVCEDCGKKYSTVHALNHHKRFNRIHV